MGALQGGGKPRPYILPMCRSQVCSWVRCRAGQAPPLHSTNTSFTGVLMGALFKLRIRR